MRRWPCKSERGVTAIVVAIALVAVGAFMALALNVGHMMAVRGELQNATDAAALAGAADIDGTSAELTAAPTSATDYAEQHWTDNNLSVIPNSSDVTLGHWDFVTHAFYPKTGSMALDAINAVQVYAARDAAHTASGGPLSVFFNYFLGATNTTNVNANSIAVRGGPCTGGKCVSPFVFADCQFCTQFDANGNCTAISCGSTLTFYNNNMDNFGLTTYSPSGCTGGVDQINNLLKQTDCPLATVGDPIKLCNGTPMNAISANLQPYIDNQKPMTVAIVHFSTCPPLFSSTATITGFATITPVYISPPGGGSNVGNQLQISIDCSIVTPESPAGCSSYGTYGSNPVLVQ